VIVRCALVLLLPSLLLFAGAASAGAQEWHEAYRDGVKALDQGQAGRAVGLIEYAVSKRPQPGRDIITYGTNVQRQYYPYLKLAEAYVKLHDLAGARSALKRSETWAREPAEERRRLAAQVDALAAAAATPAPAPPTPAPVAPPTTVAAEPPTTPAPARREDGDAAANGGRSGSAPRRRARSRPGARRLRWRRTALPHAHHRPAGTPATMLEVVSQPPGASATWTTS
jgi:hypothetical protein